MSGVLGLWVAERGSDGREYSIGVYEAPLDAPQRNRRDEGDLHWLDGGARWAPHESRNRNEPRMTHGGPVMCPCIGSYSWHGEHEMDTMRDTTRKYRLNGGRGALTGSFHCWGCGRIRFGDSWHCKRHEIDFCMECRGSFGRDYLPSMFFEMRLSAKGWSTNLVHEFEDMHLPVVYDFLHFKINPEEIKTSFDGTTPRRSPSERDRRIRELRDAAREAEALATGGADVKGGQKTNTEKGSKGRSAAEKAQAQVRGKGKHPRGGEQKPKASPRGTVGRAMSPLPTRKGRRRLPTYLEHLTPEDGTIDVLNWWNLLDRYTQRKLDYILKDGRDGCMTHWNWWGAAGYLATQLLRHGKRGNYDQSPQDFVKNCPDIRRCWKSFDEDVWMKVSDMVQFPNLKTIGMQEKDLVDYVKALRFSDDVKLDRKRMDVKQVDGVWHARAVHGHSQEAMESAGVRGDEGVLGLYYVPPRVQEFLYFGFAAVNADDIRRDGILCGGAQQYRASIHATITVNGIYDDRSGQAYQGTKGNAYAVIDIHRMLKYYTANGKAIPLYMNKNGARSSCSKGGHEIRRSAGSRAGSGGETRRGGRSSCEAIDLAEVLTLKDVYNDPEKFARPEVYRGITYEVGYMHGLYCIAHMRTKDFETIVSISTSPVTDCTTGAIVNAANEVCLGGVGVDGAVNELGGQDLLRARRALPIVGRSNGRDIRCRTGRAVATSAGNLPCTYVIHAVGPDLRDSWYKHREGKYRAMKDLINAYKYALRRAQEKRVRVVAFSLISAGRFKGVMTGSQTIGVGLMAIADYAYDDLQQVFFCAYKEDEVAEVLENCDEFVRWKPTPVPTDRPAPSDVARRVELTEEDPTQRRGVPAEQDASTPAVDENRNRKKRTIVTVIDADGVQAIVPERKRNVVPETALTQHIIRAEGFYHNVMDEEDPEELRKFESRLRRGAEQEQLKKALHDQDRQLHRALMRANDIEEVLNNQNIIRALRSTEISDTDDARMVALNGSHSASSASALAEVEQGASEAAESHPAHIITEDTSVHSTFKHAFFFEIMEHFLKAIEDKRQELGRYGDQNDPILRKVSRKTIDDEERVSSGRELDPEMPDRDTEVPGGISEDEIAMYAAGNFSGLAELWQTQWLPCNPGLEPVAAVLTRLSARKDRYEEEIRRAIKEEPCGDPVTEADAFAGLGKVVKNIVRKYKRLWQETKDDDATGEDSSLRRRFLELGVSATAAWADKIAKGTGHPIPDIKEASEAAASIEHGFAEGARDGPLFACKGDAQLAEQISEEITRRINPSDAPG
ncbi:unnamed protein product [Prorocentrum cordatum]|uniref:Macro domain-containing protein n=1 Tax=Prorocentrum cordatum TaxID=2364126 RepID=A0ABN9V2W4_9DINO|nr:unnamed protein product [Polarella glacialis]